MKLLIISLCTGGMMKNQFIEYCREWVKRDIELFLITNDDVKNEDIGSNEILNLEFKRNKPWTYFSLRKIHKAKKFIKRINPDLIFLFTPHPDNLFLFKTIKKYKLLTQVHDPISHSGNSILDKIILNLQLKKIYKYSDYITVAGENLKKQIVDLFKVNPDKIISIPLALLPSRIIENNECSNLDIDILFYGRIWYYKGVDVLIDAIKYFDKPYKLYILGKGKLYFDVSKYDNVKLINEYISDYDLVKYINSAKLVVLPYRDASGTMIFGEIFQYGIPVVATDVGVFKEYLHDAGIIVPPNNPKMLANAINEILLDDEKRKYFSNNSKKYATDFFNIEIICKKYYDLFLKIINE